MTIRTHDLDEQHRGALPAAKGGVPPAGATGEVLTKTSGADYAVAWMSGGGGGGGGGSLTLVDGLSNTVAGVTEIDISGELIDNTGGRVTIFPQIHGDGTGTLNFNSTSNALNSPSLASGIFVDDAYNLAFGTHTPGDYADAGVNWEVGSDFVGLYMSEKDSGTIQIYPDSSGGYDVELKDRGSGKHWKLVATDGAEAIPSRGMLPQYSAAPSSPVEGQSYYDTTLHKSRTYDGTTWQNHW